jgi:TnpA family transposase
MISLNSLKDLRGKLYFLERKNETKKGLDSLGSTMITIFVIQYVSH